MMRLDPSVERLPQLRKLRTHATAREIGEYVRIPLPSQQRSEHGPRAYAKDVGSHRGQFEVGALERFLQPVRLVSSLLDQCLAIASQLAYGSNRRRRDETR